MCPHKQLEQQETSLMVEERAGLCADSYTQQILHGLAMAS